MNEIYPNAKIAKSVIGSIDDAQAVMKLYFHIDSDIHNTLSMSNLLPINGEIDKFPQPVIKIHN